MRVWVRGTLCTGLWAGLLLLGPAACSDGPGTRALDTVLVDLSLTSVAPTTLLPGSRIIVGGDAFVDDPWGESALRLSGVAVTASGTELSVDLRVPAQFVDFHALSVSVDAATIAVLGGEGATFDGEATVEVTSAVDGSVYRSAALAHTLAIREHLSPVLTSLPPDGIVFPNEPMAITADGLLLPDEGQSVAEVSGCFRVAEAQECEAVPAVEVPVVTSGTDRTQGTFSFSPRIAGIEPGRFEGRVRLRNRHADEVVTDSEPAAAVWDLEAPFVAGASTDAASIGQYVFVTGAGFAGNGEGDTVLHFEGTFTSDFADQPIDVDVLLLPEVVDGHTARYVISPDDAIGQLLDVRYDTGVFEGTFTPEIAWMDQRVAGDAAAFSFRLLPVRQIVWLDFRPGYVESLRHFGLRALDQRIRDRVREVIARDYATINLEIREERPQDFALFATVEVSGPDPNGLGLLGYDNTQGKDTDNVRLYDTIGGVNALTQQDGYPGYGGVFVESFFGYSADPGDLAEPFVLEANFDALFDPLRADRGGAPVSSADLGGEGVPVLDRGDSCPTAGERRLQIACATWALGSMVGSTISHEIGHSLGLADPYGGLFHDPGDEPDRLMDADRPFGERAEIGGEGPSRFCSDEYAYLRQILPTDEPDDPTPRPSCY